MSSTISSSTSLSAKSRKLQRAWPSGGSLQAKATRRASCSPSSLRRYSLFGGRLFRAASRLWQHYCLRTLQTVGWLDRLGDPLVHPSVPFRTLIGLQQDAGVSELAGGGGARGDEPLQMVSFGIAEDDWIFLLHNGMSVPAVSLLHDQETFWAMDRGAL